MSPGHEVGHGEPVERADGAVLERLRAHLRAHGVAWREIVHGPVRTSAEAAAARGEPLAIGGKALLMKAGDAFALFVLSAALQVDSAAIKARLGARKLRFASAAELAALTGLVPGSVPPFGEPVLPCPLWADESVLANERIAFNAGSLTTSMVLATADWRRAARPTVFRFAAPAGD